MKPETLEALKGSIEKWERIVSREGVDGGTDNCPLCQLYNTREMAKKGNACVNCAVPHTNCHDTPYEKWTHHQDKNHVFECVPYRVHDGCKECQTIAEAEVDYLKSLLPDEEDIE